MAAAASTETAVEPATRRPRRCDTSLGGVLMDDNSVGGSGNIIISSNNGRRWRRTVAAAFTEAALELSSGGDGSKTPTAPWYQLERLLINDSSGGKGLLLAAAMADRDSGRQHP